MAAPAIQTDALDALLASLDLPQGGFTGHARAEALARLRAMGLPGRRHEYWRWTDVRAFTAPEVAPSTPLRVDRPIFSDLDRVRIVFTDGAFDAAASDDLTLVGVEIARLAAADAADIHWAKALYGTLEAAGQSPVTRPLAALNTAAATDGVLIRVTGQAAKPLHISYRQSSETSQAMLHHVVRLEEGAEITVIETGTPGARANIAMEVDVARGARFHHVRPQGRAQGRRIASAIFARVAEGALFKTFTLSVNGVLTRNEAVVDITGDDAVAHVASAAVGDGPIHHDDTVFITHQGERCESRQVAKKVLRKGATAVFQGKILVKPGAQKTDGYQISQALLLDDDAQFLTKPELEIYADDVKCSHGSTSGAIDETALFYLRSRGVPQEDAQALLVLAFLAEALEEIDDAAIAGEIRDRLDEWVSGRPL